jgi:hypothetical protein
MTIHPGYNDLLPSILDVIGRCLMG